MPPTVEEFAEVLSRYGVEDASVPAAAREALDLDGWCLLPDVLDAARLEALRELLELELATAPETVVDRQGGTRHVSELPWQDRLYDVAYTHPALLASVHHVLGRPFRLFHLSARDPRQGFGLQGLHTDWMPRQPDEPDRVVTALWLLDDFTADNGATRLVPGSHRGPQPLPKTMTTPDAHHPDERLVEAPAGSVLVFNAHLYHGGTRNEAGTPRRVLQCQFVAFDSVSPLMAPPPPPEDAEPAARVLLGAVP